MARARRNPQPPTGAEQRRYARGYSRTFKKTTKTKTTKRRAAAASSGSRKTDAKRRSRRETVYRQMKRQGLGEKAAAARAMREVPFLKGQKSATFHGAKAYTGKAVKVKRPKQFRKTRVTVKKKVPATKTITTTRTKRQRVAFGRFKRLRVTDPRTGKSRLSYLYKDSKGKRRKIPAWAVAGAPSAKAYRDAKYEKRRTRITKRRESSSRRVAKRGGVFTPNRTKRKTKMKGTKRSRAAKKGWATRRRRKTTRRAAAKKSPRKYRRRARKNPSRAGTSTALATPNRRRRRTRKNARSATPNRRRTRRRNASKALTANPRRRRRTRRKNASRALATPNRRRKTRRKARRNSTRRRLTANKSAARSAAARKAWRTRQRRKSAGVRRGRGRAGVYLARGKVYYKGRKPRRLRGMRGGVRKLPKGRIYVTNKRRKTRRKARRNGLRRNGLRRNSFMASFKTGMKSAVVVTTGFVAHKALTRLACDLAAKLLPAPAPVVAPTSGLGGTETLQRFMPLIAGGLIAATGTFLAGKFAGRERAVELGAGMLTSFLHTTVVTLLDMNDSTRKALPYVAGYDTQSTAAAIGRFRGMRGVRGVRGVRGMRGLGQQGPATSILPMYAPTGRPGGIQQAVAGRGTGEYFQTSGVGEYFASGVQGIGQYEPAGPMVTQAAAGLGQEIDNGIMPNQADAALTLAEAQAGTNGMRGMKGMRGMRGVRGVRGMGRGLGEFISAQPGQDRNWEQYNVPTSNTWIPGDTNAQLWAGTSPAQDALQTSEIPAGVLESSSGNGIF